MYDLFKLHHLIDINNKESFNTTIKGNVEIIKKRVRFNSNVSVILISTLDEYDSFIKELLWYTSNDYKLFKKDYSKNMIQSL